ncbi:MAG TPA: hypothetical protein VG538_05755 [Vicinamibacterales bacterium]|nr:hypothetical protein [Vicinamibacterales bacterium]
MAPDWNKRINIDKALGRIVIGLVVVGGAIAWLRSQPSQPAQPAYDASAVIACRDFRSALKDTLDGTLTNAELRQRVQKVHDNARLADSKVAPGVADGARLLLAATTSGNRDEQARAIDLMRQACSQPGANRP